MIDSSPIVQGLGKEGHAGNLPGEFRTPCPGRSTQMSSPRRWTGDEPESSDELYLISMCDLAWNLVVVFMVASVSLVADATGKLRSLDLQMGRATSGDVAEADSAISTVTISADGGIAIDGRVLGAALEVDEELRARLKELCSRVQAVRSSKSGESYVWIVPDRGASWEVISKIHGIVSQETDGVRLISQEEGHK